MEPKSPSPLGQRVEQLRVAAGISARALSLAIGATHSVVAQIENGSIQGPRPTVIAPLARALGTTMEFLVSGEGEPPTSEVTRTAFAAFRAAHATEKAVA